MNVSISATGTYDFRVVSTGTYRSSTTGTCDDPANVKRKIEAKLHGESGGGGGGGPPVNPGYYTPSNILIDGSVSLAGVSLFSMGNIVVRGLDLTTSSGTLCKKQADNGISPCNPRKVFQDDVNDSSGVFTGGNSNDPLLAGILQSSHR